MAHVRTCELSGGSPSTTLCGGAWPPNEMARFLAAARVLHVTTSNAKRAACALVALALLHLLLSMLWNPTLSDSHGGVRRPATTWGDPSQQQSSILDSLDESLSEEDCISLLRDSRRISSSVRQELQLLEDQHRELAKQVGAHQALLLELEADVKHWRRNISAAKAELSALHKLKADILQPSTSKGQDRECEEPVVILPQLIDSSQPAELGAAAPPSPQGLHSSCDMETCFDLHRCSLMQPLSVHLPQAGQRRATAQSKASQLVDQMASHLQTRGILSDEPSLSCVNIVFRAESDSDTWDGLDRTANTVVFDWRMQAHTDHGTEPLAYSTSRSIAVSASFSARVFRRGYDIVTPPPVYNMSSDYWRHLKPLLPVERKFLLYFQGVWSEGRASPPQPASPPLEQLMLLQKALGDKINLTTECDTIGGIPVGLAGWQLCDRQEQRVAGYSTAIFSLIPANEISPEVYIRLIEALRWGSIPVLVGRGIPLPFDDVINWQHSAVVMPMGRFNEIHYILKSFRLENIMEMKRRCRFLFETYFRSPLHLLEGVLAVLHHRMLLPSPPSPDYTAPEVLHNSMKENGEEEGRRRRRVGWHNFTSFHDPFNLPPGPSHSYPSLPTTPEPLSGYQYMHLTDRDLPHLPKHIVKSGGITGPEFSHQLLGNRPEETFTAVLLTYNRFNSLVNIIGRLSGVPCLNKVIVVWNNPSDPPPDLEWPWLPVPLKVVRCEGNSLNNRFLPFRDIQTEAVLSLDDDVALREEEITMAFRVWRENRDCLVGFPARFHSWDARHRGWLYNSNHSCEISMVLTGAAFLHKYYFYLYSNWLSEDIRSFVDQRMNCEDIAMNFLVAHITRRPPIKVTTRWSFTCPGCSGGMWTDPFHFTERHKCINFFASVFGYTPLLYTQWRADSVLFKTRLPGGTEKCFPFV